MAQVWVLDSSLKRRRRPGNSNRRGRLVFDWG